MLCFLSQLLELVEGDILIADSHPPPVPLVPLSSSTACSHRTLTLAANARLLFLGCPSKPVGAPLVYVLLSTSLQSS